MAGTRLSVIDARVVGRQGGRSDLEAARDGGQRLLQLVDIEPTWNREGVGVRDRGIDDVEIDVHVDRIDLTGKLIERHVERLGIGPAQRRGVEPGLLRRVDVAGADEESVLRRHGSQSLDGMPKLATSRLRAAWRAPFRRGSHSSSCPACGSRRARRTRRRRLSRPTPATVPSEVKQLTARTSGNRPSSTVSRTAEATARITENDSATSFGSTFGRGGWITMLSPSIASASFAGPRLRFACSRPR